MQESLKLFDSICNNKWFGDTSIILFLNKKVEQTRADQTKRNVTIGSHCVEQWWDITINNYFTGRLSNYFNRPSEVVVGTAYCIHSPYFKIPANLLTWNVQLLYVIDTYTVKWRQREVIYDFPHHKESYVTYLVQKLIKIITNMNSVEPGRVNGGGRERKSLVYYILAGRQAVHFLRKILRLGLYNIFCQGSTRVRENSIQSCSFLWQISSFIRWIIYRLCISLKDLKKFDKVWRN